jgi:hypothetical protein
MAGERPMSSDAAATAAQCSAARMLWHPAAQLSKRPIRCAVPASCAEQRFGAAAAAAAAAAANAHQLALAPHLNVFRRKPAMHLHANNATTNHWVHHAAKHAMDHNNKLPLAGAHWLATTAQCMMGSHCTVCNTIHQPWQSSALLASCVQHNKTS